MATDWLKLENRIRATPLDLLRQGLQEKNWQAVGLAFTMLTGEVIFDTTTVPVAHVDRAPSPPEIFTEGLVPAPLSKTEKEFADKKDLSLEEDIAAQQHPLSNEKLAKLAEKYPAPADLTSTEEENVDKIPDELPMGLPASQSKVKAIATGQIQLDKSAENRNYGKQGKVFKRDFKNTYVDNQQLASADKKFNPSDMADKAVEHQAKIRQPIIFVDVKCQQCGKEEKVHPELAPRRIDKNYVMRYLCNNCSKGK